MGRVSKLQPEIDPQLYTDLLQWQRDCLGLYGANLIVYSWLWTKTQGKSIDRHGITAAEAGCLAGIDKRKAQAILDWLSSDEVLLAQKIWINRRRNTYLADKPKDLRADDMLQSITIQGLYINQGLRTATEVIVYSYIHSLTVNGKQRGFYGDSNDENLLKWLYGWRAVWDANKLLASDDPADRAAGKKEMDNMARTVRGVLRDLTARKLLHCNDKNKHHRIYKTTLGRKQLKAAKIADIEAGRRYAHAKVDEQYNEIVRQRLYSKPDDLAVGEI